MKVKMGIQKRLNHRKRIPSRFKLPHISKKWIILARSQEMNELLVADGNGRQKISDMKPFANGF